MKKIEFKQTKPLSKEDKQLINLMIIRKKEEEIYQKALTVKIGMR